MKEEELESVIREAPDLFLVVRDRKGKLQRATNEWCGIMYIKGKDNVFKKVKCLDGCTDDNGNISS